MADLFLQRKDFKSDGIFGLLSYKTSLLQFIAVTLEHAYPNGNSFLPKIRPGVYSCQRGVFRLEGMTHDFMTFQVLVEGHTDLLFHKGNMNSDSSGCILLGQRLGFLGTNKAILESSIAFLNFMNLQKDVDEFKLLIT